MGAYDREAIERLVPTIWDRQYAWGMVNDYEAPADMPKVRGPKNTKNTLWAHLADIRIAWDRTLLTRAQRQALVLVGGMGLSATEAGAVLGVRRQSIQESYDAAVGHLMRTLNGDALLYDEEGEAAVA